LTDLTLPYLLPCLIVSYRILSYLIVSYRILSYLILSADRKVECASPEQKDTTRQNLTANRTVKRRGGKCRAVLLLDLNTKEVVSEFPSIVAATKYIGAKSPAAIWNCCHKKSPSAHGFLWAFAAPKHDMLPS
jgi:hypothetical protein